MVSGIVKAVNFFGNQNRMAKALGVSRQSVTFWVNGKAKISPVNVLKINKITRGAISPSELRPDIYPPSIYFKAK